MSTPEYQDAAANGYERAVEYISAVWLKDLAGSSEVRDAMAVMVADLLGPHKEVAIVIDWLSARWAADRKLLHQRLNALAVMDKERAIERSKR